VTGEFKSSADSPLERQENREQSSIFVQGINDEVVLAARVFLATLFLIFGWRKRRDYSGTVSQMLQAGILPTALVASTGDPIRTQFLGLGWSGTKGDLGLYDERHGYSRR
jgi:hypothetical protein